MIYIFDNSPLSALFRNYYRGVFRSLWDKFDVIIDEERLVSTREVFNEIDDSPLESLRDWATDHRDIFTTPTAEEARFVTRIFQVEHFGPAGAFEQKPTVSN